jgi:hypothetical protein
MMKFAIWTFSVSADVNVAARKPSLLMTIYMATAGCWRGRFILEKLEHYRRIGKVKGESAALLILVKQNGFRSETFSFPVQGKINFVTSRPSYIVKKRKQMDLRYKELHWLLGRTSFLSVNNKLLFYKTVIASIWSYVLELWCCASKSNIAIIQRCQSKTLRAIAAAPWYVTNVMIHNDLGDPPIHEVIHDRSSKHRTKLQSHWNPLLRSLPREYVIRRLKRRWPADL